MLDRRRTATAAGVLLAAVLGLAACGGEEQAPAGQLHGTPVDPPFEVADVPLTDTDGESFSLARDLDNRLTLLFFGYTTCPTECPLVMNNVSAALVRLDDAAKEQVDFVFVTTDPRRDGPAVIERYLERAQPPGTRDFRGLTGDLDQIATLAESVGIFVADAEELASGGYDLGAHGTQLIGLEPDGEAPVYWGMDTSGAELAADIERLLS